ncbi:MAG: response regulator [Deltaproteobacteria bacterium]
MVITDMSMPKMAGDEVAARILDLKASTPIILYTGYSEQMTQERAEEIGIKRFAYKPLELPELACMVREVLDEAQRN